jgi:hypothetical protein
MSKVLALDKNAAMWEMFYELMRNDNLGVMLAGGVLGDKIPLLNELAARMFGTNGVAGAASYLAMYKLFEKLSVWQRGGDIPRRGAYRGGTQTLGGFL